MSISITFDRDERPITNGRKCGGCTLCCKLLPVRELQKLGGERCRHQSHARGCKVYHGPGIPISCKLWSCRWLTDADAMGLSRPDRSHAVIDPMPDFVTARDDATGLNESIEVIQLWIDPAYPDAHREPGLRAYLARLCAARGAIVLVRYDSSAGFCLIPPGMNDRGEWIEHMGTKDDREHSTDEIFDAVGRIF